VLLSTTGGNLVPGDTNERLDLFVRDTRYGITTRVTLGSDGGQISHWSYGGDISGDGRYVVFHAHCGCVVPGDTNDRSDIFVRDPTIPRSRGTAGTWCSPRRPRTWFRVTRTV
jgi:hypothetical protein